MKNEDVLAAVEDLRTLAAEEEGDIADFVRSPLGKAVVDAASLWASLVWRPGSERPEKDGWYRTNDGLGNGVGSEGRTCFVGGVWNYGMPAWWSDGALPPVPTKGG